MGVAPSEQSVFWKVKDRWIGSGPKDPGVSKHQPGPRPCSGPALPAAHPYIETAQQGLYCELLRSLKTLRPGRVM